MKIEIVDKQGYLIRCDPELKVHATNEPFNWLYFKEFVEYILSASMYQKYQQNSNFNQIMEQVVEEIVEYFKQKEDDSDLNELAGYFIDEVDVDFNVKIDEEQAYLVAEWINDGYFRMTGGDYDMLINCQEQIQLFQVFQQQHNNKYKQSNQYKEESYYEEEYEEEESSQQNSRKNTNNNDTRTITF